MVVQINKKETNRLCKDNGLVAKALYGLSFMVGEGCFYLLISLTLFGFLVKSITTWFCLGFNEVCINFKICFIKPIKGFIAACMSGFIKRTFEFFKCFMLILKFRLSTRFYSFIYCAQIDLPLSSYTYVPTLLGGGQFKLVSKQVYVCLGVYINNLCGKG